MHRFSIPNLYARCAFLSASFGFSLVEVTLAIGILSVSLLTTVGLIPVGLGTMCEAMDCTVKSQIIQQITSNASRIKFSNLTNYVGSGPFYFNQEGQLLSTSGAPEKPASARFKVTLSSADNPGNIFPGAQSAANLPGSIRLIKAVVSDARSANGTELSTHILYISNSGG